MEEVLRAAWDGQGGLVVVCIRGAQEELSQVSCKGIESRKHFIERLRSLLCRTIVVRLQGQGYALVILPLLHAFLAVHNARGPHTRALPHAKLPVSTTLLLSFLPCCPVLRTRHTHAHHSRMQAAKGHRAAGRHALPPSLAVHTHARHTLVHTATGRAPRWQRPLARHLHHVRRAPLHGAGGAVAPGRRLGAGQRRGSGRAGAHAGEHGRRRLGAGQRRGRGRAGAHACVSDGQSACSAQARSMVALKRRAVADCMANSLFHPFFLYGFQQSTVDSGVRRDTLDKRRACGTACAERDRGKPQVLRS
eukprot:366355-Chlamydomonas_euryale.AAC.3